MSDPNNSLDIPELDEIARLLGEVRNHPTCSNEKPEAASEPRGNTELELADLDSALNAAMEELNELHSFRPIRDSEDDGSRETASTTTPATQTTPSVNLADSNTEAVPHPREYSARIARLTTREFFRLVNWHGSEVKAADLRKALFPEFAESSEEAESVGEVMSSFQWDDEE